MKKLLSTFLLVLFTLSIMTVGLANSAQAVDNNESIENPEFWGGAGDEGSKIADSINEGIMLGDKDPREIAASVINIILGFLGIVAVIIVLAGGFKWMTAGGNQDKVDEAKKLMTAGVVGLVIVLAAFGMAKFIIDALVSATT
ncbi:hypothetical protein COT95_00505 [Candidatus Falkowbacteria bacterium CG10_big_fil_rev_8_21_14_0_10_37_6]|uniref:Uncharacterized protein n=1 Tax=Candidatus Falkowbacteria bacterium CG10_big_fil_rev_8_21_14_0_10_37_6 TaxID=1974563 RepID=A0A2H0V7M0_9BACT|nr:MAG: hypothetical protein COT95_00505 [Candidatus Falkowbacteria bacterium CG10_big_fil_rev_8_21_14_0_10_37_6]